MPPGEQSGCPCILLAPNVEYLEYLESRSRSNCYKPTMSNFMENLPFYLILSVSPSCEFHRISATNRFLSLAIWLLGLAGAETGRVIWTIATATTATVKFTTSLCNPPNDLHLLLPPWPGAFPLPPNSHPLKWLQIASFHSLLGIISPLYISCSY